MLRPEVLEALNLFGSLFQEEDMMLEQLKQVAGAGSSSSSSDRGSSGSVGSHTVSMAHAMDAAQRRELVEALYSELELRRREKKRSLDVLHRLEEDRSALTQSLIEEVSRIQAWIAVR